MENFNIDILGVIAEFIGIIVPLYFVSKKLNKSIATSKFLQKQPIHEIATSVCYNGYTNLLEWMKTTLGVTVNHEDYLNNASKGGHMQTIEYLVKQGCKYDTLVTFHTIVEDNIESLKSLKWLLAGNCPCSVSLDVRRVARHGRLDILQFLFKELDKFNSTTFLKISCNEAVCMEAAAGGHLDTLQLLRKYNFPWNQSTTHAAAENNHLELLKWALEHKCPWNNPTRLYLNDETTHHELLEWLTQNGFQFIVFLI